MAAKIKDLRAYFEERIIRMPIAGCWLWTGSIEGNGYAVVQSTHSPHRLIHRLSWHWFVGPIPNDMYVLHKCDVKCCVNPNHLFLGSLTDNNRDRMRKGRSAVGARSGSAKLTEADVRSILIDQRTIRQLAKHYGVCKSTITSIRARKKWKYLYTDAS